MLYSKDIYEFKSGYLFLVYVILYTALNYFINSLVLTDTFYYSVFGEQLSADVIKINHTYSWIGYLASPLLLLLKLTMIAGVVFCGIFMFDKDVSFKNVFKVVMIAELVMILAMIFKLVYFIMWPPQSLDDISRFSPLSLTQLIDVNKVPVYFLYPLQQLNLFEVVYWLLITTGISLFAEESFFKGLKITTCSYGVALSIWIVGVIFLQLQFGS